MIKQKSNTSLKGLLGRIPLWIILVFPFLLIMFLTTGLTGYLSYQNSQTVVDDIAGQVLHEIEDRIEAHLGAFLDIPLRINQTNANLIRNGNLDINDAEALGRFFWQEVQIYPSITSIYFGNPQGGLIVGGREGADGSLYIMQTENFQAGTLSKHATDATGDLGETLLNIPQFDARLRPWYTGALANGDANWIDPYVLSTGQDLAIAASLPVYNAADELLGVVSIDIFLSHIRTFLADLQIGKTGQAYIIDHNGLLVSSSNTSPSVYQEDSSWQRLLAVDSSDAVIAQSAQFIINSYGDFERLEDETQATIGIDGKAYYLWISPFHEIANIDWLVVIAIPKADFLAEIEAQNQINMMVTGLAVVLAFIVAIAIGFQISRPISRLSAAASQLAEGNLQAKVPIEGLRELRLLGDAFNTMSSKLSQSFSQLEQRVQARTAELAASEARYRAIIEDQTELISRFSPDTTLTFVNDAYCRYYGKSREELIGIQFLSSVPQEEQEKVLNALKNLNANKPSGVVEHYVMNANGQLRWMQWVNRALYDETGQFTEFQSVGRDISAAKLYEESLEKALAQEAELNSLKSQFIATVSHEFRTPMAIILNSSELIERYAEQADTAKQGKHLQRIKTQIHHMTSLLEDVLSVSRANTGSLVFKPELIDLTSLCQEIIEDIEASSQRETRFELHSTGACTELLLDKKLLRLILQNLLSNAAKFSPEGASVSIDFDCQPEQVKILIRDEGIGIPEAAQSYIFDAFYRAENVETIGGTGLGLTIVKHAVDRHGGKISFESADNAGTSFTIILPTAIDGEQA